MRDRLRVTALLIAAMAAGYVGGLMSETNTRAVAENGVPSTSDVLRAKRFELVDSAGGVRGIFGTNAGSPFLWLIDSSSEKDDASVTGNEPLIGLLDASGKARGVLGLSGGEMRLAICDADGKTRSLFGVIDAEPALVLCDAAGRTRGQFSISKGDPRFDMWDTYGKLRQSFGLAKNEPVMLFGDSETQRRGMLGMLGGEPALMLLDQTGAITWSATVSDGKPSVKQPAKPARVALSISNLSRELLSSTITGVAKNESDHILRYACVEFNVYDAKGAQIGTASASTTNLEAGGQWKFKAAARELSFASDWKLVEAYGLPE